MKRRGHWGVRGWRAAGPAVLLATVGIPQVATNPPLAVQAAAPVPGRPELATYAGAPAAGKPTDVAQQPFGLAVFGRYTFVADPVNHLVRLLIDNSEVAFAGAGSMAVEGDGGNPAKAQLAGPYAVAIGQVTQLGYQVTGFDVYIADTFGDQVRKATVTIPPIDSPSGSPTAVISTLAGAGGFGFSGDHGLATTAKLNSPYGVAWDAKRNQVYIADTLNNRVRVVDKTGTITTLVGAPLLQPRGLAVNGDGLYIADTYNNVVRRYDLVSGALSTVGTGVAGFVDGVLATAAQLKMPSGLAFDDKANLFIADTGNNAIRELSVTDHVLRTVAGTGKAGEFGDRGPAILAQLSSPTGVAVRSNGDVVIADSGNNLIRVLEGTLSAAPAHNIHIEAGNGTSSFAGDGQPPTAAQFAAPAAVVSQLSALGDAAVPAVRGQRYIVDTFNQTIRTFVSSDADPDNHAAGDNDADDVSTLAGTGGLRGLPDASSTKLTGSRLAYPMGSALSPDGSRLYVADTFNNVVRAVDLTQHTVTTVAGTAGKAGYGGDGQAATSALLSYPTGVAVDQAGDLFIADTYNGRIREVIGGTIYTVAGTGRLGFSGEGGPATAAGLYFPYGISVDASIPPNLFITDSFDHRIRKAAAVSPISPKTNKPLDSRATNVITTLAGTGDQAMADGSAIVQAQFNRPWSAALDQTNLYVADYLNQRIRRIDLTAGTVTTVAGQSVAGSPSAGLLGDAGPADAAEVNSPRGVSTLGGSGGLLVADSFNGRIRWLGVTQAGIQRTQLNFDPTNLAGLSQPQSVTVSSTGSGLLVMGAVDLGADRDNFYLNPAKNSCAQARLEPGSSCSFEVAFQPRAPGGHTGSVVIPNDAIGGAQVVTLTGRGTASLVSLSPPAVVIHQPANAPPAPGIVTLSNNGDGLLHITSIGLDQGTSPGFSQSNNCPSVMTAHSSCQITVMLGQIAPDDKATRTGMLTVVDDAAGNSVGDLTSGGTSQSVPLTGSLAQSMASFSRQSMTFTQNLGASSANETILLVNTGQAPLHLSAIHDEGDFSQTNNCPTALAPGASCTISVTFIPTNLGERDGYIVVADDSVDSPQRIPVTGISTMALARLGPSRLNFSQNVGATSAQQTVTLTNGGDGPLTIAGIAATGDFKALPHCPSVLLPGLTCPIGVTFTPQGAGARHGSLLVTDDANAAQSQDTVKLDGIGYQPVATLSTAVLTPGSNLGGSAGPQTVTVTNTGDGALTIRAIAISGAAAGDYRQSSDCVRTLQPGATCTVTINFTPQGYGLRAASLTLYDDGAGGSQSVALHGTGTAARVLLSSGFVNFGGATVGNPTAPQSVVLFNGGNGTLSITGIRLFGGDYTMSTNCGNTLAAGASCTITVTFLPQGTGARSGVVTITDNAGTQRITLSGVGT
ncbi:MAG TPA: choice-of-anchor D domain-containing protein [Candidatus Dormibacteraeota bacterium]|nr:choice-of-anchor D domain-containing protein [Candidatus Dormibacteraeota bacterium]